jgi:EAL domain-containing protein (putative c-di-GMP-specific phosphodiesterase class I)/GGDEF domain-containing protein
MYNYYFNIAALFVYAFTILCIFLKKGVKKSQNKMFLAIIIVALLASAFDVMSPIANDNSSVYSVGFRDTFNYLFLILHNATPFMFFTYIWLVAGETLKKTKWTYWLFCLPYLIVVILLLLNISFRWCFYYDESGTYSHGKVMTLVYVIAYAYIILSLGVVMLNWKTMDKKKKIAILIFIIMSLASVVFQMLNKKILIELFIESLTLLGFLFTIEDAADLVNPALGVYNRHAFLTDMSFYLTSHPAFSLIGIKFQDFTYYTKTLGIKYTAKLNKQIASFLSELGGAENTYHCGNGVFAIYIPQGDKKKTSDFIDKITARANEGFSYLGFTIKIFPELVLVRAPEDVSSLEDLIVVVDAPYQAPQQPNHLLTKVKFQDYAHKIALEKAIERGIAEKRFYVCYQPIWWQKDGRIHSAEALCRLIDPELGPVQPDEFIPAAAADGKILYLGEFILRESCRFFKEEKLQEKGIEFLEVNLSVVQCMHPGVAKELFKAVKEEGVEPSSICFEITESAAINSKTLMEETLSELKSYGFRFALDDYGTGYSNFSYMLNMPFDIIKIDKSILWAGKDNPAAEVALAASIGMLKKMGYTALCEGAETSEQVEVLVKNGIDCIQGFFFSKPIKGEEMLDLLAKTPEDGLKY